MIRSLLLVKLC